MTSPLFHDFRRWHIGRALFWNGYAYRCFWGIYLCCWNVKCCIQGVICEAFEMCWEKLFEYKISLTKRLQWNYAKCSNPLGSVTPHGTLPVSIGNTSTNGGVFHCYVSLRECNIKFSTFWNGFLQSCICLNFSIYSSCCTGFFPLPTA